MIVTAAFRPFRYVSPLESSMPGWSSAPGHRRRPVLSRSRLRAVAAVTAGAMCLVVCAPVAAAAPAAAGRNVPPVKMYGYAKGPAEREGSAAGRAHYVPASDTQAGRRARGTQRGTRRRSRTWRRRRWAPARW